VGNNNNITIKREGKMTASQFKAKLEEKFPKSYFFSKNTMRFFGDTMRNYGVRMSVIDTYNEKDVPVW
jgi:hypothetical protein